MGISMIIIMLFHQHFVERALFNPVSTFGLWGVDIFMFVSGYGCAYSIKKSGREGHWIRQFYWRRATRIMPAALIAGWIMLPFRDIVGFKDYVGMHLWYMKVIVIFYAMAPFAYILMFKMKGRVWMLSSVVATLMAIMIYCIYCIHELPFWNAWDLYNLRGRLPAFILGMAIVLLDNHLKINKSWWAFAASLGLLVGEVIYFNKNDIGFSESNFHFLLPALPIFCLVCTVLRRYMSDALVRIVEWFGKYSLELYLVHEFLFAKISTIGSFSVGSIKLIAAFALSTASAALLNFIAKHAAKLACSWKPGGV